MRGMRALAATSIATSLVLGGTACTSQSKGEPSDGTATASAQQPTGTNATASSNPAAGQSEQIILSMCNGAQYAGQRRLVRINLSDESTDASKDTYFSVEPEKYDSSIAQCNSGYSGAQQALAYADAFSKLAVTYNKGNVSKHIGYETSSSTPYNTVTEAGSMPDNVIFQDLSGATSLSANPDNNAGGIGPDGRIYYGDYDEASSTYSIKSVSLNGGDNKLYKKLGDDGARSSYFQPGAKTPTVIPSGGLIQNAAYLPMKDYGFTAFDTTVRAGTKAQLETGKGLNYQTDDSTTAPKPFEPLNKVSYLGYTENTISSVELTGFRVVVTNLLTVGATIKDPVLTKDGKYIIFATDTGVFRMPRDGSTQPTPLWTTPDQNTVDLSILGTTTDTK